jgi:type IV pilus assembly protein PilV
MILEALIAILVFSMGILAIVGLQAVSIKLAGDAKYRADASLLAEELLGQMWTSDRVPANMFATFGTGASACAGPTTSTPGNPGQIIGFNATTGAPIFGGTTIVTPALTTPAALAACAACTASPTSSGCTSYPTYTTWLENVKAALPGTVVNPPTVVVDTTANTATTGTVTVTVRWQAPNDGLPHSHTVTAQIR